MRRNYTKAEIQELIWDLASEDPEVADLAMSDLLMVNSRRHLSDMIAALNWGNDTITQRICYILGAMIDEQCIDPLLSVLNDENVDNKLAAIDSLQYFPTERIIPPLEAQLKHEDENVREAIINTLGVFMKRGVVNAHLPLLALIQNEQEPLELRLLALLNMQHLDDEELKPVLATLSNISDASIYSHILLLQDGLDKNQDQKIARTHQLLDQLFNEKDALKQIRLEDQLVAGGSTTAKLLIDKIFAEPENGKLRVYARMILDKMGHKAITAFIGLFESFDRFEDLMQVVILQDLINSVSSRQYSVLSKSLLNLLNRINAYLEKLDSEDERHEFDQIKSDIHFALASYDCREAVEDMKTIIQDGVQRQYLPLIEALIYIGDRDFLIPLINQFQAYRNFKRPSQIVKKAFQAIVRREKIKRDDPIFDNLSELQKENLSLIMKR